MKIIAETSLLNHTIVKISFLINFGWYSVGIDDW